ncbi:AsmA family protein [Pseudothauera nasutitermitis]|uniref:AsmA family protein n=1 Tax=Pseudothauera nasutitermitis TaxID=2565930 RepID=A0A4S4AR61_9RHOO|nr:AsmA family protein [Pseudothauera nasutitermitis]THF62280.1 AsmA family protein [Pseudothauera nasutitermitis]
MKAIRIGLLAVLVVVLLVGGVAAYLLATFDANRHKDELVRMVREQSGRELRIEGDLGLALFPRLALTAGGLHLSDPDGRTPFAAIEEVELAVRVLPLLRGAVEVERARLIQPVLHYRRTADGRSNFDDLLGAAAGAGSSQEPADKPAGERAGNQGGGREPVFDIQGIELSGARILADDAQAGLQGEIGALDLKLGRLAPGVAAPLTLDSAFALTRPALRGTLALRGDLGVQGGRIALDGLAVDLNLQPAGAAPVVLALRGELAHDSAASATRGAFNGTLDGSRLEGGFQAAGGQPLRFELKLDRLDVDRYAAGTQVSAAARPASENASGEGAPGAPQGRDAADPPVDLSFAAGQPLAGRLEVGELQAAGLRLSMLSAAIQGDGRTLTLAPFSANGYGGRVEGELRIDGEASRVRTRQTYTDIQIGPLLRDLADQDVLEGRGRLQLELDTRGRSVGELKRALAGNAALALRDGAVKGVNIGQILRDGQALLSARRDQSHQFRSVEQTDFSALDASFRIAGGVARNDDLALLSPLLRVGGAGAIDIGQERIDYTLRASVVASAEGQGGAGLDQLRGLTVPVRISGPLASPATQVLWSEVAGEAARRALSERLNERLGGGESGADARPEDALKEELNRRLRGLLR